MSNAAAQHILMFNPYTNTDGVYNIIILPYMVHLVLIIAASLVRFCLVSGCIAPFYCYTEEDQSS